MGRRDRHDRPEQEHEHHAGRRERGQEQRLICWDSQEIPPADQRLVRLRRRTSGSHLLPHNLPEKKQPSERQPQQDHGGHTAPQDQLDTDSFRHGDVLQHFDLKHAPHDRLRDPDHPAFDAVGDRQVDGAQQRRLPPQGDPGGFGRLQMQPVEEDGARTEAQSPDVDRNRQQQEEGEAGHLPGMDTHGEQQQDQDDLDRDAGPKGGPRDREAQLHRRHGRGVSRHGSKRQMASPEIRD